MPPTSNSCSKIQFFLIFLLSAVSISLNAPSASAQTGYDPAFGVGIMPLQSYSGADVGSVNLLTGQLTVRVPLASLPQRGGKLSANWWIAYDSMVGAHWCAPYNGGCGWSDGSGGYAAFYGTVVIMNNIRAPQLSVTITNCGTGTNCVSATNPTLVDQEGRSHPAGWLSGDNVSGVFRTLDGSGYLANWVNGVSSTVIDRAGISYYCNTHTAAPCVATDPNGNQLTYTTYPNPFTDTVGRQVTVSAVSGTTSGIALTLPGPNGGTSQFQSLSATGGNQVSSITLPNNSAYSFQYTTVTLPLEFRQTTAQTMTVLQKITLPTGGSVSYGYAPNGVYTPCAGYISAQVTSRTIDANDGTGPHTWTYSYSPYYSSPSVTTETDPLGNKTIHTFSNPCFPYESTTQYQDNAGHILKTVQYAYSSVPGLMANVFYDVTKTSETTTWANGQTQQVSYTYDKNHGLTFNAATGWYEQQGGLQFIPTPLGYTSNPFSATETDFGSSTAGPPLRTTIIAYQAFSGLNSTQYKTNNFLDLPYTNQVQDGSGTQRSLTQYNYDETARSTSGLTTSNNWTSAPPTGNYRGNVTSVLRWLSSGSLTCPNGTSGGSGSNIISKMTYFDSGMLNTSAEPCGGTTTYNYSLSYVAAYPTTVTNALNQTTTNTYDLNIGRITNTKDPNDIATGGPGSSYSYDSMWRIASISYPDGSSVQISRHETSVPFSETTTRPVISSSTSVSTTIFDGFYRVSQTQLTSDPDGPTFTDTVYDALGRVYSTSNPYRSKSESTYGVTSYTYDPLGRTCVVAPPDGTALPSGSACPATSPSNDVFTTYSGSATTTSDQAGKSRKSASDGLSRLTDVWEDPAGLNYHTVYTYDALGNLLTVVQNGSRNRSFVYDSLARLTSATNPESGTASYTYDPNGNLTSKTSPAPNQTGTTTVTLSYCYDALNRLTSKAYTLQSCPMGSPIATYFYDQASYNGLTIANGIGRRTGMSDQAGAEAWSYDITPGVGWKTTDRRITNGIAETSIVQSNLAGSMASFTYPSGRTITYSYSTAGRPISAIDLANSVDWVLNAHYTPFGSLASLQNSNGQPPLITTHLYNARLQPCRISVSSTPPSTCTSTPSNPALDLWYTYGSTNNGNVNSIANGNDTYLTQNFTYDSLNRIATAHTNATYATRPSECWAETYGYDAWGNLTTLGVNNTTQSAYVGCPNETGLATTATSKNQLAFLTYDAAGNVMFNPSVFGGNYTYDAENHLIKCVYGSTTATYTYDGDGKRVTSSMGKMFWYGNGSDATTVTDLSGNNPDEYIFFNGTRHGWRASNGGARFIHTDHLGTVRDITYGNGVGKWDYYEYYPFGNVVPIAWNPPNDPYNVYKFTGKERDSESGLDNFGARYNSSSLGRFMSPDPDNAGADSESPQSWNGYSYVSNNPLNRTDPGGLGPDTDPCNGKPPENCIVVIGGPASVPPLVFFTWVTRWPDVGAAANRANDYLNAAWKAWTTTRPDPTCLAASTLAGAAFGATKGPVVGGVLGLAGGPAAEFTVSGGAGLGALVGGTIGGIGGYAFGQVACRTGSGGGGGGGGNNSPAGSTQRMTNAQAKEAASRLGYNQEVKDPGFNSHGNKVFTNGENFITADRDMHSGGVWKMFDSAGNRLGTYDANLVRIGD